MMTAGATFESLAMPHLDAVYRVARRLARGDAEAEDLVQDTYLRAFRAFDGFELRKYGIKPWLLKILHNAFYSRAERQGREPTLLEDLDFENLSGEIQEPGAAELGAAGLNWEALDDEVKAGIETLPTEYREVLLLWALEELSYKEIAEVCGCPIGTVMSRLYRARQQMSRQLGEYARERGLLRGVQP